MHTEIWTLIEWAMMMGDLNGVPEGSNPYAYTGDGADELWTEWYTRILAPVNGILKLTDNQPFQVNKHTIACIWRAWVFHRISDFWGSVPYSEAILGVNPGSEGILPPAYDSQKAIYADLLEELKAATASFDLDAGVFAGADPH